MPSRSKRFRYQLEFAAFQLLSSALRLLPPAPLLTLASLLGQLAFLLDYKGRPVALANLAAAFPNTLSPQAARRVACLSYQNFARTMAELLAAPARSPESLVARVSIHFPHPDVESQLLSSGAVWVTPHFGNFEWCSYILGLQGFRFTIIAENFKNPALTDAFRSLRQGSGHQIIPQNGALVRLMKSIKAGGHAALLTDLNVPPSSVATRIRCFGLQTCATTIHVRLAARSGKPIVPGICLPRADGHYRMEVFPPIHVAPDADPAAVTQQIWDTFEAAIREAPELWMWMYKHWRYRPAHDPLRDPESYPHYAHRSGRFEKIPSPATQGASTVD